MSLTKEQVSEGLLRERQSSFSRGPMVPFNCKFPASYMVRLKADGEAYGLTATQYLRVLVEMGTAPAGPLPVTVMSEGVAEAKEVASDGA